MFYVLSFGHDVFAGDGCYDQSGLVSDELDEDGAVGSSLVSNSVKV